MRTIYSAEQLRSLFASARQALERLEVDYLKILARDPACTFDGYPSARGGGRSSQHGDPTYEVVVHILDSEVHGSDAQKCFGLLHQAAHLLEQADGLRAQVL